VEVEILGNSDSTARRAAERIASEARAGVEERGRFSLAVSGGTTPSKMLRALADEDVPWQEVHLFQVDERVAPADDPDRNLIQLRESLLDLVPLPEAQVHPMPVEEVDLEAATLRFARTLEDVAGDPVVLDLAHLGLGPDGHTASLVPGDAVLGVEDADVAVTETPYQGRLRMTVTFPLLDRARRILWLVTGASKADMLVRLREGDAAIPAGRVRQDRALVLADRAAAGAATG
jgi:6-phosphogluconolactonase